MLRPVDSHPLTGLMPVSGVAIHKVGSLRLSYYPLGYPMPYGPVPSHSLILPMVPGNHMTQFGQYISD
jgi:hypothetical protein